jgi:hypothetical protein
MMRVKSGVADGEVQVGVWRGRKGEDLCDWGYIFHPSSIGFLPLADIMVLLDLPSVIVGGV